MEGVRHQMERTVALAIGTVAILSIATASSHRQSISFGTGPVLAAASFSLGLAAWLWLR
jgi:hypothetical protein